MSNLFKIGYTVAQTSGFQAIRLFMLSRRHTRSTLRDDVGQRSIFHNFLNVRLSVRVSTESEGTITPHQPRRFYSSYRRTPALSVARYFRTTRSLLLTVWFSDHSNSVLDLRSPSQYCNRIYNKDIPSSDFGIPYRTPLSTSNSWIAYSIVITSFFCCWINDSFSNSGYNILIKILDLFSSGFRPLPYPFVYIDFRLVL